MLLAACGLAALLLKTGQKDSIPHAEAGPAPPPAKTARQRFDNALGQTDRGSRSRQFGILFAALTAENAAEFAAELWENEKNSPFQNDWLEFLRAWAGLDPLAAAAFAEKNAGGKLGDWMLVIVPEWAGADPQAAARWWLGFDGVDREKVGAALMSAWAKTDWRAAAEWIEAHCSKADQSTLAKALALQALTVDGAAVEAFVENCRGQSGPSTEIQKALFTVLAESKLQEQPDLGLAWLAGMRSTLSCPDTLAVKCEQMLVSRIQALAAEDACGPWISWLASNIKEDDRGFLMARGSRTITGPDQNILEVQTGFFIESSGKGEALFQRWLDVDSEAASGWLAAQREEPFYQPFAAMLALTLATDPESADMAEAWVLSISSQDIRKAVWFQWFGMGEETSRTPAILKAVEADGSGYLLNPVSGK